MALFDAIVIGSGPAGTFAAYALRGRRVLVLDVGYRPRELPEFGGNLYDLRRRKADMFSSLIGERFESLHNLHQPTISLKLKSPLMTYVAENWRALSPLKSNNFECTMSFAQGGLANAWGAGVYRFTDRDLTGFPISAADLAPYYDELTAHIGISGANDDLEKYFGHDEGLQPPLRLSRFAGEFLQRYQRRKGDLNERGIFAGMPRLAVLTREHRGRAAYSYDNLEFFRPHNPAIYNPAFTLNELVARGEVEYQPGYVVLRYREIPDGVEVIARNLASGAEERFAARALLLAAGTLNTAKLVLQSNEDYAARLPILDNAMSCIPLIDWRQIGAALDPNDSSLAQLNLLYDDPQAGLLQATLYGTAGPLRSDLLFDLPLAISANIVWSKYLAPAMALLMVFYPAVESTSNYLRLDPAGHLEVNYATPAVGAAERRLIGALRKLGYFSSLKICQFPPIGSSLHYAGSLPMRERPSGYETDPGGKLYRTRAVYVVDGACFSALPAKNLTFTIMANAMRIAARLRQDLA